MIAVERLADDRVLRRFDDRREQAGVEQLARLLPLGAPLRRDVAEDQNAAGDPAALVADRRSAVVDRALHAVLADEHRVVRQARRPRLRAARAPPDSRRAARVRSLTIRNTVVERLAARFRCVQPVSDSATALR